jgi:glycine/D-amino acid oxidase-like deaminating enzyme
MGHGEVPEGLPRQNPTTSYWQVPPHTIADHRTTADLPTSTVLDTIIIGSGISGAAIAYKLLNRDPTQQVLMLEARTAASGASGRNGGHCRAGWWLNFKKYTTKYGVEEALKFDALEEGTVADIAAFVKQHNVDCDFANVEAADAFGTEEAWAMVQEVLRFRSDAYPASGRGRQSPKTVWTGQEADRHLGLNGLVGAITYPAHTQNPYLLVCSMLELSLDLGLNLQTSTPAYSINCLHGSESSETEARWEVETDRGRLRAKNVVLATNGYTNALHAGIASTGFLQPSRSQVTALRPKEGDLFAHPALKKSIGLDDLNSGDYFMIRAPHTKGQGDVLYGGGRFLSRPTTTDDTIVHDGVASYLHDMAPKMLGGSPERWEVSRDWCGITCYTPDSFPLVGSLPGEEGLWASVGMNGHGMAMAFRCAEALVDMIVSGTTPEWLPKAFRIERILETSQTEVKPAIESAVQDYPAVS